MVFFTVLVLKYLKITLLTDYIGTFNYFYRIECEQVEFSVKKCNKFLRVSYCFEDISDFYCLTPKLFCRFNSLITTLFYDIKIIFFYQVVQKLLKNKVCHFLVEEVLSWDENGVVVAFLIKCTF